MNRKLLAACAALVAAVGAARAADPQPLWEIDTTAPEKKVRTIEWVGFSPDGKVLVARVEVLGGGKKLPTEVGYNSERLLAWDTKTRKERFTLELGRQYFPGPGRQRIAFTESGTILVPGEVAREVRLADGKATDMTDVPDNTVGVWLDAKSRRTVWDRAEGFGPDLGFALGQLAVVEGAGRRAAARWAKERLWAEVSYVRRVAVDPEVKQVAFVDDQHSLRLYSIATGDELKLTEVAKAPIRQEGRITSIQFNPDGKILALGSTDGSISLWDVTKAGKEWKPYATTPQCWSTISCLAFSPDGRTLAAGTFAKMGDNLHLIDVRGEKVVSSRKFGAEVTAVAYSADGKLLVTGHSGGKVRVWEAAAVRGG